MAIEWLKDLATIRRTLEEADASDRLIAIHSLEILGTQEALKILDGFFVNAVNHEKYFVERASRHVKAHLKTGEISAEVQKSLKKLDDYLEISRRMQDGEEPMEPPRPYEEEDFQLGEIEESLKVNPPPRPEEPVVLEEEVAVEEVVSEEASLEAETSFDDENSSEDVEYDYGDLIAEPSPEEEAPTEYEGAYDPYGESFEMEGLLPAESDSGLEDDYEDLLPPVREEEAPSESYDQSSEDEYADLLPTADSSQDEPGDDYGDLLPPLDSGEVLEDDYDDLLPPMKSSGDRGGNEDILAGAEAADEYEDLLPPMGEESDDDYEDLLPPMRGGENQDAGGYDDLLPPLKAEDAQDGEGDYEDLLPPAKGDPGTEEWDDLLPPMKTETEGDEDDYADLLPPLKQG